MPLRCSGKYYRKVGIFYQVIAVHNVPSTYHVPLLLEKQGLVSTIRDLLKLDDVHVHESTALINRGA
jgi:CTP synthase